MSDFPRRMPKNPTLHTATVVRSERRTPSFQRVTVGGPGLDNFQFVGMDQWFRLFIPTTPEAAVVVPEFTGRAWWQPYLDLPDQVRPHCSNYTVAEFRRTESGAEMDIDVVLHWNAGANLCGAVAIWADQAQPGQQLALLDQGLLFDPAADTTDHLLVADETGLPAVRGILRDLPEESIGRVLLEVPTEGDVEQVVAPAGMAVTWLIRRDPAATPGRLALAAIRADPSHTETTHAFVVGESALATGGRRALKSAGLSTKRIYFSGFWRHDRTPE
ncbi:siderophore-interacting protein [soil metagenome]